MTETVGFRIFSSDGQWKLNRNEEFVCVFESQDVAISTCQSYREEIVKHGGEASIVIDELDGTSRSV